MARSCSDVCDEVLRRLKALGFKLDDTEDHEQIFDALGECVLVRPTPYLLVMRGDCEPETMGPFETPQARDQKAREIRQKSDRDGVYGMDVVEPKAPSIWPYSGAFIEGGE